MHSFIIQVKWKFPIVRRQLIFSKAIDMEMSKLLLVIVDYPHKIWKYSKIIPYKFQYKTSSPSTLSKNVFYFFFFFSLIRQEYDVYLLVVVQCYYLFSASYQFFVSLSLENLEKGERDLF